MTMHSYLDPDRFVAGTVGPPGQRIFFLQAHDGLRTTNAALEKEQVRVLAERLDAMLDLLLRRGVSGEPIPPIADPSDRDSEPLLAPVEEDFRVAVLRIAWDGDAERVLIEAASEPAEDDDVELSGEILSVRISGRAARAFVARAESVVSAGRPPCPFCTLPLDPEGHICPRSNGYRRR
jgi:uncharacterized repeat protein (TIGR03847 family)